MLFRPQTPGLALIGSILLATSLGAILLWKDSDERAVPIILQCAAALREPIEEIVPIYERETGQRIEVRYGESQKILTDLELTKQGDIFLPADDSYIDDADKKGLLGDIFPLARMNAALVVNRNYGKPVAQWSDLFGNDVRIAIANPNAAAISRVVRAHLEKSRKWQPLHERCVEMGPVTQVANAVKLGRNVDAGIIWDCMVASPNYRELKIVTLAELDGATALVKIGVVKDSPRYAEALRVVEYIVKRCPHIFRKHGFTSVPSKQGPNPETIP